MANPVASILSISNDESLLRTRHWILETAGFRVSSALGFTEASQHCRNAGFDLVIIGHSIPPRDRAALLKLIRMHNHTRVLALHKHGEAELIGAESSLEAWEGPEALIAAVKKVLALSHDPEK